MTVRVKRIKSEGDTLRVRVHREGRETCSPSLFSLFADGHSKTAGDLISRWIRSLRRLKEDITVEIENVHRPYR